MNELRDLIEITGNLVEEAWNNGRREALRERGAEDLQATVTALEAANKVLGEKLEKAQARIEELETNQETEPELKPCPFCGGDVKVDIANTLGGMKWFVECKNIRCDIMPCTSAWSSPQDAIEAWNERADG